MIITIDTSKDSKEDIRKAVAFLSSLHGEDNSVSFQSEEKSENAFASMFGGEPEKKEDNTGFVNIFSDEEQKNSSVEDELKVENPLEQKPSTSELLDQENEQDQDEIPQVMQY